MKKERSYWFKAKKTGLGWSTPLAWQGWLVYIAMFAAIAYFFVTGKDVGHKLLGAGIPILGLSVLLDLRRATVGQEGSDLNVPGAGRVPRD